MVQHFKAIKDGLPFLWIIHPSLVPRLPHQRLKRFRLLHRAAGEYRWGSPSESQWGKRGIKQLQIYGKFEDLFQTLAMDSMDKFWKKLWRPLGYSKTTSLQWWATVGHPQSPRLASLQATTGSDPRTGPDEKKITWGKKWMVWMRMCFVFHWRFCLFFVFV